LDVLRLSMDMLFWLTGEHQVQMPEFNLVGLIRSFSWVDVDKVHWGDKRFMGKGFGVGVLGRPN